MTIKVFVITNVKQKIKQTKNLKTFCFSKSLPFFLLSVVITLPLLYIHSKTVSK